MAQEENIRTPAQPEVNEKDAGKKSTIRSKLTFATMIIGNIVSLVMSIGFVYITLPTTFGLILAIGAGIATTYFQSVILYNVLILQKKEKLSHPATLSAEELENKKIKGGIFLFITIPSILITAVAGALGVYQGMELLGATLDYPSSIVSIASIACTAIMGIGYLLAGYDQANAVYQSITCQVNSIDIPAFDTSLSQTKKYTGGSQNSEMPCKTREPDDSSDFHVGWGSGSQRFFRPQPDATMPRKTQELDDSSDFHMGWR